MARLTRDQVARTPVIRAGRPLSCPAAKRDPRDKLGVDMEPYLILGACNPSLAHQALNTGRRIGLLLPCNVVVQTEASRTVIGAFGPQTMAAVAGEPSL